LKFILTRLSGNPRATLYERPTDVSPANGGLSGLSHGERWIATPGVRVGYARSRGTSTGGPGRRSENP
jgi:hypothetical protein